MSPRQTITRESVRKFLHPQTTAQRVTLAGSGLAVVAALTFGGLGVADTFNPPVDLHGTITIISGSDSYLTNDVVNVGNNCQGGGGYGDLAPGAAVDVSDKQGNRLATGQLGGGKYISDLDACQLKFHVPNLPPEGDGYVVQITHRGEQPVSLKQARTKSVDLFIGGDD